MSYRLIRFSGSGDAWKRQWLEYRKGGLGGSDAAAVLGMSPYATPYTVWLEKTRRIEPDDLSDNEAVYWGMVLEDTVAAEFAKRHPDMTVKRRKGVMQCKERPWQFATVDRVTTDAHGRHGVLEIKTAGAHRGKDWENGVPDYYLPQVTHYMAVTGYDYFDVAVLIGGQRYLEFHHERDDEDVAVLNEREQAFWEEYVMKDVPPLVTGKDADADALMALHATSDGEYLMMLDEDVPMVAQIIAKKAMAKQLDEEVRELTNQLRQIIGDAKGIQTPSRKVTWVRTESTSLDTKRLKSEAPELFEQFSVTKPKDMGLRFSEQGV